MAIAPNARLTAYSIPPGSESHMGLPQRINFAECLTCPIHVVIDILRQMSHYLLGFNEIRRSD